MKGGQPIFLVLVLLFDLIMAFCRFLEVLMCQCYGKRMMVTSLPFLFGMILDLFKPGISTGLAWLLWMVLFVLLLVRRSKLEK